MNLSEITVDPAEAAEKAAEYARDVEDRTDEDAALAAAYKAAACGRPIISLRHTITAGGWHDNGLPKLAVARAGTTECFARWFGTDMVFADQDWSGVNQGALVNAHSVRVPVGPASKPPNPQWRAGRAMVPIVPPQHRPRWPRLRSCHVLWEVEAWEWVAPEDPALIRRLIGDLWEVRATWDLTELERLVLTQRA